jgi:hypothetical protein
MTKRSKSPGRKSQPDPARATDSQRRRSKLLGTGSPMVSKRLGYWDEEDSAWFGWEGTSRVEGSSPSSRSLLRTPTRLTSRKYGSEPYSSLWEESPSQSSLSSPASRILLASTPMRLIRTTHGSSTRNAGSPSEVPSTTYALNGSMGTKSYTR